MGLEWRKKKKRQARADCVRPSRAPTSKQVGVNHNLMTHIWMLIIILLLNIELYSSNFLHILTPMHRNKSQHPQMHHPLETLLMI
jgi:hypothetical protein